MPFAFSIETSPVLFMCCFLFSKSRSIFSIQPESFVKAQNVSRPECHPVSKNSSGWELYDLFIINKRNSDFPQTCVGDRPQIRGPDYTQGFAEKLGRILFWVLPLQGDSFLLWESVGICQFVQRCEHVECKWSWKNTRPL